MRPTRNTDLRIAEPLFPEVDRQVAADLKRLQPKPYKTPIMDREWSFPAALFLLLMCVAGAAILIQKDEVAQRQAARIEIVKGMQERQIAAENELRWAIQSAQDEASYSR